MDDALRPRHRRDPEPDPSGDPSTDSELTVVHHPDGAVTVRFAPAPSAGAGPLAGFLRALVVSAIDPLNRGRLEITVPAVGQTLLWAESCLAPGDKSTPDVGEQVWVGFEEADPQRPVWLGLVRP